MTFRKFKYFVEELWILYAGALFFSAMVLWLVPKFYHDAIGEAGLDSNARPAIATVIRSGNVLPDSGGGIVRVPSVSCGVIYKYVVSGTSYTNRIKGCDYAENHPKGSKIRIYYNMEIPKHSSISKSNPNRKRITILIYMALITAFLSLILLFMFGLYRRTKQVAVRFNDLYD